MTGVGVGNKLTVSYRPCWSTALTITSRLSIALMMSEADLAAATCVFASANDYRL